MKKYILIILLALVGFNAFAQSRLHRRCGTSMILQREVEENGANTRAISSFYNYVPHKDTVTIPVILVNFSDVQFTVNNPKAAFDQFFNGTSQSAMGNGNEYNHGSVSQYFRDMSSGDFQLNFKVYGPVTVDSTETYYGGSNENDNQDENPRQLVADAISKLQASGDSISDASDLSSDGSTIDCVYIIYAGMGQNDGGDGTTVWANTWTPYGSTRIAGKSIRYYSMAGELSPYKLDDAGIVSANGTIPMIAGIGVTCHELSHAFGLPDMYPTSSSAYLDNQEMEYWDLMDGGEYTGNGFCPTAYTAFEKNEMGWPVDIQELSETKSVAMSTSTEQGGTAYKIVNLDNTNEYLMLELIRRSGWNTGLYGDGLLVYHVNKPSNDINSSTGFNNTPNYPGMAVIPADGLCASSYVHSDSSYPYFEQLRGDLFPGSGNLTTDTLNVTELSDANPQPNFCWYNSSKTEKLPTGVALQNISYNADAGTVSFNFIHDASTGISNILDVKQKQNGGKIKIYSIAGQYLGDDLMSLPNGVYIVGGRKVVKK